MSTKTKSPTKSLNMWTGIATIFAALFAIFGIAPDPVAAGQLTETTTGIIAAVEAKNWAALAVIVFNSANIIIHLFKTWFLRPKTE